MNEKDAPTTATNGHNTGANNMAGNATRQSPPPSRFDRLRSLDITRESNRPKTAEEEERSQSMPDVVKTTQHPSSPTPLQPIHARTHGVSSTNNLSDPTRSSFEFDRRYDGPFGRPSLSMTRRRSSQPGLVGEERDEGIPEALESQLQDTAVTAPSPEGTTLILEPEPPPLNYTLRTRKKAIFLFWFFIIFDSVIMPIALYFGLWYGVGPGTNTPEQKNQKLSANAVFSIVTAAIGGASILEYFVRFWRLYKKASTCRVIGARRWYLDWFHWNFSLGWIIIMLELIIGTVPENPPIRLLSMPLSTMLFVFGTELLLVDSLRIFHVPSPCRMSSIPKGAQLRPCIYTMIEDVCAVDGSGGTAYRQALNKRYEASHIFRAMLRRLGVFWAVGAESTAVMCTILIFTISDDAAYTVGWSVPFIWAGIWTLCTFWYVKKELKRERIAWSEEVAKNTA